MRSLALHNPSALRFWSKVNERPDGCWEWTGSRNLRGYGQISVDGRTCAAHRIAYELIVGPIPDELTIDHLCSNKWCVNPDHLEPVTGAENTRRAWENRADAPRARQTHCYKGHPYSGDNVYTDKRGRRFCRACKRATEMRRAKKLAPATPLSG